MANENASKADSLAWDTEEVGLSVGVDAGPFFAVRKGERYIAMCTSCDDADYIATALNVFDDIEEI